MAGCCKEKEGGVEQMKPLLIILLIASCCPPDDRVQNSHRHVIMNGCDSIVCDDMDEHNLIKLHYKH